jgi:pyruvate, orthophosphate dikinase
LRWADQYRKMQVRTNADTPADAENAVRLGAEGIGLCRTEHMFFDSERIPKFRRMILSDTVEQREAALKELIPYQREDFIAMYKALRGRPMTVRFLDPPLHEFLPKTEAEIRALAQDMGFTYEHVMARIAELHEFNPMMGLRGCRLGVIYPEITRMQTRAVIEAAIAVKLECNYDIVPEIMIPLVGDRKELLFVKHIIVETAEKVMREKGYFLNYKGRHHD